MNYIDELLVESISKDFDLLMEYTIPSINKSECMYEAASLENSYVFNTFNESKKLTDDIVKYIKTASIIDIGMIEEQVSTFKRVKISPLLDNVLNAYNNGDIEILYNKMVKIPTAIPYIIRKAGGTASNSKDIKVTILIGNFSSVTDDQLKINSKELYVLMESAYIALQIYLNPMRVNRSMGLSRLTCGIYTEMFLRILSREYALSLDQGLYDNVSLVISRFYLEKIWEMNNQDTMFNIAVSNMKTPDYNNLKLVWEDYTSKNITSVVDLLLFIKSLSVRFDKLSVKYVLQRYMVTYHGACILALDYLPYIFFVIINTIQGSFLLNDTILTDIIKKDKNIRLFYPELSKL